MILHKILSIKISLGKIFMFCINSYFLYFDYWYLTHLTELTLNQSDVNKICVLIVALSMVLYWYMFLVEVITDISKYIYLNFNKILFG